MKKTKVLVAILLLVACICALLCYYFFYRDHLLFLADEMNRNGREQMARYMGISYYVMRLSVYGLFMVLAISMRWFKKINNWLLANLILILPVLTLWIAKYVSVPVLFTQSMALADTYKLYLISNIVYLLIFIGKITERKNQTKTERAVRERIII